MDILLLKMSYKGGSEIVMRDYYRSCPGKV